jgi:hypothetical protein
MYLLHASNQSSFSPFKRKRTGCISWFIIVVLSNLFHCKKGEGNRCATNETFDIIAELKIKAFSDLESKTKGEGE